MTSPLATVALALATAPGCSLGRVDYAVCEDNQACRDAFGWGQVCGETGLCEPLTPEARCDRTVPSDLLQDPEAYADHVILGSLYDDVAFSLEVQSIELAVRQVNDNGGLQGREYAFVHCTNIEDEHLDKLDQITANKEMAVYLADEVGVAAMVGPATSGRTQDAYLAAEPFGTVLISPSATSPALTALDGLSPTDEDPGLLWRTAPPDSLQGVVIALDMQKRGIRDVAVVHQTGAYGEGLGEVFAEEFTAYPGRTAHLYPFDDASNRDEQIIDAGATDVEEVLFISSEKEDTVAFLNAVGSVGEYTSKGIFLTDGGFDVAIFEDATQGTSKFADVRGTAPSSPDNLIYDAFVAAFSSEYSLDATSSGFTSYAFDAGWLAIYGTAWSSFQEGEITGLGIARGLRQVADPDFAAAHGVLPVRPTSWATVVANFETGAAIDIDGSSGSLDFDPETEETTNPIDIWIVSPSGDSLPILCTVEPGEEDEASCPGWTE